jgi:hypothetical protein
MQAGEAIGVSPGILKSGEQSPAYYADLWATITSGHRAKENWSTAGRTVLCTPKKRPSRPFWTRRAASFVNKPCIGCTAILPEREKENVKERA